VPARLREISAASALLDRVLDVAGGLLRLAFGFLGQALGLLRLAADDLAGLFLNLAGGFLDRALDLILVQG
jgi:hypothetical protein